MKLQDAKQECERWLSYLEAQKERSIATQKIASDVRKGVLSSDDGKRALRRLDNAPTVYDGAKLADAVLAICAALTRYVEGTSHD